MTRHTFWGPTNPGSWCFGSCATSTYRTCATRSTRDSRRRPADKLAALKPRIETLKAAMADFKEGHSLSFTNDPAKGVAVDVNGVAGGEIQGADFSKALLAIWIGAEPPNEDLKSGLLGGKCE